MEAEAKEEGDNDKDEKQNGKSEKKDENGENNDNDKNKNNGKKRRKRQRGRRKKKCIQKCFGCNVNAKCCKEYKKCKTCDYIYCNECWNDVFMLDDDIECYGCQDTLNGEMEIVVNENPTNEDDLSEDTTN